MITFRPDTSFPFLKIARENGVPYDKVLAIADEIETHGLGQWGGPLAILVDKAITAERERRAKVAA